MKNYTRIIFLGNNIFSLISLERLLENNYNIVCVVTNPDKPAGRGGKIYYSPIKICAIKYNLRILQPTNFKDDKFISNLRYFCADIYILVSFRFIPKEVWSIPILGSVNLHASLLPHYRGAAPINHTIINGEIKTGVTTFMLDNNIDTGDLLLQRSITINADATAGMLYERLSYLGADLVVSTLEKLINKNLTPKPQIHIPNLKLAQKISKKNCQIDWTAHIKNIYNLIRGLSPYPGAFTKIIYNHSKEKILKIYKAGYILKNHNYPIAQLNIFHSKLIITTKHGFLDIKEVQIEGRSRMTSKDFINGIKVKKYILLLNMA